MNLELQARMDPVLRSQAEVNLKPPVLSNYPVNLSPASFGPAAGLPCLGR